ncbi:MAG: glycoside hydrolase family 3 C-terminal domain-containing protein [Ignavibacteriae bacterium]|nr:glycoside hydrolase family 3 C-terminal domain-containing protein [Ignavibacteriota bacterium]
MILMKRKYFHFRAVYMIALSVALTLIVNAQVWKPDANIERRVDSLLALMTLEEKIGQLNQMDARWDPEQRRNVITPEQGELLKKGLIGSYLNIIGAEVTKDFQRVAVEESRLGIPLIFGYDVIHGYRTIFPIPLGTASSWNPIAIESAARIAATEATTAGLHWTFAPMVDIARDPRWGRVAEGAGEDVYLGSEIAKAAVRGFQGKIFSDLTTIAACAKHYAAYGGALAGRDYNIVDISERTLRETYLPPFKAAVDAGVMTLMSAFNEISGVPATANNFIMTDVLRNEWGFNGFVVSDHSAVMELLHHGVATDTAEAAVKALSAGVDMEMVTGFYLKKIAGAVKSGKIQVSVIDESVRRVLRVKFALGLFENPYRNCDPSRESKEILTQKSRAFARELAGQSIVLLKNEGNILPLKKDMKTLAVIGPLADNTMDPLGSWSAQGRAEDVVSVLQGFKSGVSSSTKILYSKGCEIATSDTSSFAEAERIASQSDAVVLVVGENRDMSGEAASRSMIDLPGVQHDLIKRIHATGKPVVLVLMNGRPLTIPWEAEHVPAILETWYLGVEAGNAIADVLFGTVNPSGKLPVTFPRNVGQVPLYYDFKNTGRPPSQEKYTSKYLDVPNTPQFAFGHGLSYTKFEYSKLTLNKKTMKRNEPLIVTAQVKNVGTRAGTEVVQLYIRDLVGSVTRPMKQLKRFARIDLKSGESKTVEFTLLPEDLMMYDIDMKRIVEPGKFKVFVGTSSVDVIETEFEVGR